MGLETAIYIGVNLAFSIGISQLQASIQRRKLRRLRDQSAGVDVQLTAQGSEIPLAYGLAALSGIPIFSASRAGVTGDSDNPSPELPQTSIIGEGAIKSTKDARFRQYLLVQYVLSKTTVIGVRRMRVDNIYIDDDSIKEYSRHQFLNGGYEASTGQFTSKRNANNKFSKLAYLNSIYFYDKDNPTWFSIPVTTVIIDGKPTLDITVSPGGTVRLILGDKSAKRRNSVSTLAHYLFDKEDGVGLRSEDIDWVSFNKAEDIARPVVSGPVAGPDIAHAYGQREIAAVNKALGTNYSGAADYFRQLGYSGTTDTSTSLPDNGDNIPLARYEVNGAFRSSTSHREVIENMLSTMPGAKFWRGLDGKYKIKLPDVKRSAAEQTVMTISDDSRMLIANIEKIYPPRENRYTQVVGRFKDITDYGSDDAVRWPEEGSNAYSDYLRQDGAPNVEDVELPFTNNKIHAYDIISSMVLQSRRAKYRIPCRPKALILEPGDIIHLNSVGINEYVMVDEVKFKNDRTIEVLATEFFVEDYVWVMSERRLGKLTPSRFKPVPAPTNLTATIDGPYIKLAYVEPTNSDEPITHYEIEALLKRGAAHTPDEDNDWSPIATIESGTNFYNYIFPDSTIGYRFRIRSVTISDRKSAYTTTGDFLGIEATGAHLLTWRGNWNAETTYKRFDVVNHDHSAWLSTTSDNLNNEPSEESDHWDLLVRRGDSIVHRGTWNKTTTYSLLNIVDHEGSSYMSVVDNNIGNEPGPDSAQWQLIANKGDEGDPGEDGVSVVSAVRDPRTGVVTITYSDGSTDQFTIIDGDDGSSITATFRNLSNGNIRVTFSDGTSFDIPRGRTGVGIRQISRSIASQTVTVTYDDGTQDIFALNDGEDGDDGLDGASFETVYELTTRAVRPSRPRSVNRDGYVPSGWTSSPLSVSRTYPYAWVSKRGRGRGATTWSLFTTPALHAVYIEGEDGENGRDGINGADGSSIEFIFRRTTSFSRPSRPLSLNRDDYVPSFWDDDQQGVNSLYQWEWVAKRVRPRNGATWSSFTTPALWATFSEHGEDGEKGDKGDPGPPPTTSQIQAALGGWYDEVQLTVGSAPVKTSNGVWVSVEWIGVVAVHPNVSRDGSIRGVIRCRRDRLERTRGGLYIVRNGTIGSPS